MNFFNGGPENLFFRKMTSMDALAGTIRGVMMQKWETVKCIDREIGQLVEKRNGIGVELFRLAWWLRLTITIVSRTKSSVAYSF